MAGCAKRRGRHGFLFLTLRGFAVDHRPVLERLFKGLREQHPHEDSCIRSTSDGPPPSLQPQHNRVVKMQSWSKITHYAGFDWAHDHHKVVIVNPSGKIVADFRSSTQHKAGSTGESKSPL